MELTILMPCLNEAQTLAVCIKKARAFLDEANIEGEVVIADNGSSDGSQQIAQENGARVVAVATRGYGAALIHGIRAAKGRYVIMGDADDSYDFLNLKPFLEKLRQGYELVMGNRFKGGIKPGAMPPLHRYLGNPVLTGIGRLFFKSDIRDFHCGLRGFNKLAIEQLNLQTTGMEFASEMVVKATLNKLKITEVPTILSKDGRNRPPHLRSWRDGWRHLRFLLIFSPRWLFLYPGAILTCLGALVTLALIMGPVKIANYSLDIHTMLYAAMMTILGLQTMFFAVFSKVFSMNMGLIPQDQKLRGFLELFSLEKSLILGGILSLAGIIGSIYAVTVWQSLAFGALQPTAMMRIVIPSLTSLAVGIQIIFGSFFLSVLSVVQVKTEVQNF
jgi:glycosyltransferase involved in cell wall biosynthesis